MKRRIGAALVLTAALTCGVAGCSMLPGLGDGTGDTSTGKGPGKVVNLPEKTVYLRGDAGPSPGVTGSAVRGPIASMSPLPTRARATVTRGATPADCTGVVRPGVVNGADVTPGTTSAVVSWWNIGDPAIVEYRLAPVPQHLYMGSQPPWAWQTVAPARGCTRVSSTVTGLTSGAPYVFVVHAVLKRYESLPPNAPEVARSNAVVMR
ncbi:hypothetical protein AB0M46_14900 [Dactylosporangium sp. NPDC051485]|uniref:hypothetical protein n=1 Tax=Dactylosporangium sp. NPDC051485 TaxID=3154846 RepID=UPI00342AF6EB